MPLRMTDTEAIGYGLARLRATGGVGVGLNNYFRTMGAHGDQAAQLAAETLRVYEMTVQEGVWKDEREVSAVLHNDGKTLNLTLKADRLPVTSFEELVDFYDIDTDIMRVKSQTFNFWGSKENPNFQVKATFEKDKYQEIAKYDREEFRTWAASHSPAWEATKNEEKLGYPKRMLEVVLSDLHIGKRGNTEDYLVELRKAVFSLVSTSISISDLTEVHLVLLGDTFNSEGERSTTAKGTRQDDALGWQEAFVLTRSLVADVTQDMLAVGVPHVTVHVISGNHDWERSWYLADSLWGYYHAHPNVTVITDTTRHYINYGSTLIGLTHGDQLKPNDLPMLAVKEGGAEQHSHIYWHMGHWHTRKEEEVQGVVCKWFGTPSGVGEYDDRKGFVLNTKECVGVVFDAFLGEIAMLREKVNHG